jgi:hypothetical protein
MIDKVTNKPIFILPSRGSNVLPETLEIIRIIKSIEPNEFISQARKINYACRMNVMLVYIDENNMRHINAAVQTTYGIIPFDIFINEEQAKLAVELIEKEAKKMPEAEMI